MVGPAVQTAKAVEGLVDKLTSPVELVKFGLENLADVTKVALKPFAELGAVMKAVFVDVPKAVAGAATSLVTAVTAPVAALQQLGGRCPSSWALSTRRRCWCSSRRCTTCRPPSGCSSSPS